MVIIFINKAAVFVVQLVFGIAENILTVQGVYGIIFSAVVKVAATNCYLFTPLVGIIQAK